MAKGKFDKPIAVPIKELASNWLHVDGYTRHRLEKGIDPKMTNFTVSFEVYDDVGYAEGDLAITYYGKVKGNTFYVTSYSYSVQGFSRATQAAWNYDPWQTALQGLGFLGMNV